MKNTLASSSFFAFLAMVLIGVCVVLLLNAPAQNSQAATNSFDAADGGYEVVEPADAPPVVDAQVEYNDVHDHTNS